MEYANVVPGIFLRRPNRFIAHVDIGGQEQICHVKNTGRCRELLVPGTAVWCQEFDSPSRKTKFDLIAVQKGLRLINMDSQAPNRVAGEWLRDGGLGELAELKAEYTHGDSRYDFSFLREGRRCFLEVKGVTLETDGRCVFPDAPTQRGTKHLLGLKRAAEEGFGAYVLFILQMENAVSVEPNDGTDPAFGRALREAAAAGVQILALDCHVTPDTLTVARQVPVCL